MEHTISERNGYRIINITKPLSMLSNISPLREIIAGMIAQGQRRIALRLADNSYLSSHSITVLIACNQVVHEAKGKLLILGGGDEFAEYLEKLGIDERFSLCRPSSFAI